ncbi:MAG: asparagine synthase-related protein [Deferrisomatales bacterium]|nr:asparagine synthase-related protein [Deferrisomatales bacterium]
MEQIRRKPWLSRTADDEAPELLPVPPHGRACVSAWDAAARLGELLGAEIEQACRGRDQVFILLSGGLDSRVAAGVVANLVATGRVKAELTAVTWGPENSRDVVYARTTAKVLGMEWHHLELGPEHLLENIERAARHAAGMISPVHLHRMAWFENADHDALVLAGSYGDMVGRAAFSGLHVLELQALQPRNRRSLLKRGPLAAGSAALLTDFETLRARGGQRPEYALCELGMHAHYTRGLLAQAMNTINRTCTLHQAFTDPAVFGYMWSIHPSFRTDDIYAELLEQLNPGIARLPWTRTNKALRGKTVGADKKLYPKFHRYPEWISGPTFAQLCELVDPEWFDGTGLFSPRSVARLLDHVASGTAGQEDCSLFAWLATVRRFAQLLEDCGNPLGTLELRDTGSSPGIHPAPLETKRSKLRSRVAQIPLANKVYARLRPVRKWLRRRQALKRYPCEATG